MIANVIGLGPSAELWSGQGFSIGVNDSWGFGRPTNHLVVINSFRHQEDRRRIIDESIPDVFWSHMAEYNERPDFRKLEMQPWKNKYELGKIYHSNNSPFVAACIAFSLEYKQIILWGVDFMDHKNIRRDNGLLDKANKDFIELDTIFRKHGGGIYLGAKGALSLEVWK